MKRLVEFPLREGGTLLVDAGELGWDVPVREILPQFKLKDPIASEKCTLRDLLTHRSGLGLGAGDLMFFPPGDLGRDEIIRRLRFIKQAQAAGFTLAEVKELLDLDAGQDRSRARALAQSRIQALNVKIGELERARAVAAGTASELLSNDREGR